MKPHSAQAAPPIVDLKFWADESEKELISSVQSNKTCTSKLDFLTRTLNVLLALQFLGSIDTRLQHAISSYLLCILVWANNNNHNDDSSNRLSNYNNNKTKNQNRKTIR